MPISRVSFPPARRTSAVGSVAPRPRFRLLRSFPRPAAVLLLMCPAAAAGQASAIPDVLPRSEEVQLALSAAPVSLRDEAGVYVLERSGFVRVRETTNGFTCIVNRDTPRAIKPVCYDAEGTATILPKVVRVGEMLMAGRPLAEINQEIAEGFRTGRFIPPRRPGIAYMLSPHIRNENVATGTTSPFPPHIMFYAPNMTNADIGVTPEARRADPTLPFVAYQGPHGFIVVVTNPGCSGAPSSRN